MIFFILSLRVEALLWYQVIGKAVALNSEIHIQYFISTFMKQIYLALAAGVMMAGAGFQTAVAQTGKVVPVYPDYVTEVDGEYQPSSMSGDAMYPSEMSDLLMGITYDGFATEIVYGDDGNVYFRDPFSRYTTDSYLRGDRDGDDVVIKFPQIIYRQSQNGIQEEFYAAVLTTGQVNGFDTYVMAPDEAQTINVKRSGDKWEFMMNRRYVLGIVDGGGQWQLYGEQNLIYTDFNDKEVSVPASLKKMSWTMTWGLGDGRYVEVATDEDNNEIYVRGISNEFPYGWIKGTVADDKVTFASGQYLGVSYNGYYTWVHGAKNDVDASGKPAVVLTPEMVFDYDKANSKLTYKDMILANCSLKTRFPIEEISNVAIFDQEAIDASYVPATPVLTDYYPKIGKYGASWVTVSIPKLSVEGTLLDVNKLMYRIFVNDEPYVFEPEGNLYYVELDGPIEWIPYDFTEYWDFRIDGISHRVSFFITGIDKVGVQSYYRGEGDKLYESEMAFWDNLPNAVEEIEGASADVVDVVFYDLCGNKVANPAKGIYVKVETLADGTRRSSKVVVKQ